MRTPGKQLHKALSEMAATRDLEWRVLQEAEKNTHSREFDIVTQRARWATLDRAFQKLCKALGINHANYSSL